jgi:predicted nucleic acid-binding protein
VTQRLVCDASALVAVLLAPAMMPFECANIIRRHELGDLISTDQAAQAHADLVDLPIELWPYEVLARRAWQLRPNASMYDAAYLALAEALGAPLVTLDRRLQRIPGVACTIDTPPAR